MSKLELSRGGSSREVEGVKRWLIVEVLFEILFALMNDDRWVKVFGWFE